MSFELQLINTKLKHKRLSQPRLQGAERKFLYVDLYVLCGVSRGRFALEFVGGPWARFVLRDVYCGVQSPFIAWRWGIGDLKGAHERAVC